MFKRERLPWLDRWSIWNERKNIPKRRSPRKLDGSISGLQWIVRKGWPGTGGPTRMRQNGPTQRHIFGGKIPRLRERRVVIVWLNRDVQQIWVVIIVSVCTIPIPEIGSTVKHVEVEWRIEWQHSLDPQYDGFRCPLWHHLVSPVSDPASVVLRVHQRTTRLIAAQDRELFSGRGPIWFGTKVTRLKDSRHLNRWNQISLSLSLSWVPTCVALSAMSVGVSVEYKITAFSPKFSFQKSLKFIKWTRSLP